MRKTSHKKEKLSERVKEELSLILRNEIKDPRMQFISFTRVDLTDDYSYAKVFWDTFDATQKNEIELALDSAKGKIRSHLAKVLKIRTVPQLTFSYDSQYEDEMNISQILKRETLKSE